MRKSFTRISSWILMLAMAMTISLDIAAIPVQQKSDTTYLHLQKFNRSKSSYLKNNVRIAFPTIKTVPVNIVKQQPADEKAVSNIEVYPNPVSDLLNLKYTVTRPTNVNIKIMDILGNEVMVLLSQRLDPREYSSKHTLAGKLNPGFYFVRIVAGNESIIKRISVL
jgi:hypothetical protein